MDQLIIDHPWAFILLSSFGALLLFALARVATGIYIKHVRSGRPKANHEDDQWL